MSNRKIKAVIFDMDGLMFDSERVGRDFWIQAGKEFGYVITAEQHALLLGLTVPDAANILRGIFGEDFPFDDIRARRLQLARELYQQQGVPLKPGLPELLDWLEENDIPKAVATSTDYPPAMEKLIKTGIAQRMNAVITGDQVKNGKPAPDIFLAAAEKMAVSPQNCLVLEDSEAGIRAAHAAGMVPVMVPDLKPPSEDARRLAHRIVASLHEVRELLQNGKDW
jgi:HAD superfamily hydrolase (TIGR01509 family)